VVPEERPLSEVCPKLTIGDYNILAHMRKVLVPMSVHDLLRSDKELRDSWIYFLQNPERFSTNLVTTEEEETARRRQLYKSITFTDEDLMAGTTEHNRPLYVSGECEGRHLAKILVDAGSSINIIPRHTMQDLFLDSIPLTHENLTIHGFNQNAERTVGGVVLTLRIGDLKTRTKFYVIEADTSYRALLGRPWIHKNYVIASTLHQCLKYAGKWKIGKIVGDIRPHDVYEAEHEDSRFFLVSGEIATLKEIKASMAKKHVTLIPTLGKGEKQKNSKKFEEESHHSGSADTRLIIR
jgi:hypothetical protein